LEKKDTNTEHGAGTGPDLTSMLPFVSYWNPSLLTDARGQATVEFQVPDNLAGWKVLAMAVTSGDQMGLGEGSFTVHPATELQPLPENEKERKKEKLPSPPSISSSGSNHPH
jgi:uncharacterized protein YfaS (alpha-2-macroglobulin family)